MSYTGSKLTPPGLEEPINHSLLSETKSNRAEEFRIALDKYMADYRRHHAQTAAHSRCSARDSQMPSLLRSINWLRHWRTEQV
jgi:hypothetical protein